jgi:hypothetical protein
MVNTELVEGIRQAVEKGDTMRNAMVSFMNAGYNRNEIQEAAEYAQRELYSVPHQETKPALQMQKPLSKPITKKPSQLPYAPKQTVSDYSQIKPKKPTKIILIILLVVLIALIGSLFVAFFLFKDSLGL